MIPQACGAKYYIKEEFLDETDVDDVVVALVNLARKVSCDSMFYFLPIFLFRNGGGLGFLCSFTKNNLIQQYIFCNCLNAHVKFSVPRIFYQ